MKNRTCFKIISFILIQTFLILDICCAAAGQAIIRNTNDATLSPSIKINNVDFQAIINQVDADEFDFGDVDLNYNAGDEIKIEVKLDEMSIIDNSVNQANMHNGSSIDVGAVTSTAGVRPALEETFSPPPPEGNVANYRQEAFSTIESIYFVDNDDSHQPVEVMNGVEAMERYGLAVEDIGFKQKVIDPLVRNNSNYFENVVWSSGRLIRIDQGPFGVSVNTPAQDAIDMAASALQIGLPLSQIIGKMMAILGFNINDIKKNENDYFRILEEAVSNIAAKESFLLKDVYMFATNLSNSFKQIGVEISDSDPKSRKTLILNPKVVPILRKEFMKNRENVINYIKYMILLHEEGHVVRVGVLAHYLRWIGFKTKEVTLNIFKKLIFGDLPGELIRLGSGVTVLDPTQHRSLVDVIKQSQWLYGYDPNKKEFKDALWKEAIANYYAFLRLIERENGNDSLAIETLALGTHYAIQFNPPSAEYLEVILIDALNSFLPFLNEDQSARWMKKVLELQAKDGALSREASRLLEKSNLGQMSTAGIGSSMFSLSAPVVFTTVTANQAAMPSFGDGSEWLFAIGAAAVVTAGVWVWKNTPFFKSVEQRTVQLVNKTISEKDPSNLKTYYQSANINDKVKIVNIAAQELKGKSDKTKLALFENIFLDGLNERSRSVGLNMQVKVKSLFKQRIDLGINSREMQAILNEVVLETGINVHQGNSVAIESKLTDIINSLARADNLNVDSFIAAIKKDYELDASIDRMLVSEFVRKAAKSYYETGDYNKALTIVISNDNDKDHLGINVNKVRSHAVEYFNNFSLSEVQKTVCLLTNASFMDSFVKAQRNAQVRVLFNNILKQIIITRETQNAALSKIITQAIQQVLPQEITGGESMFPEIAILVGRLALSGKLHEQAVFVEQAQSMSAISRVIDAEQTRALHNAIVNLLESGYKNPENTKIGLIAAEFDKYGLVNKPRVFTSGFAATVLVTANGQNVRLLNTPLAQIGEKIKIPGLAEEIGKQYVFNSFNLADQKKLKKIIIDLDKTLINNMALGLVFENINDLVAKELNDLDLKNISNQRAQLVLVNILGRGALLNDLQMFQAKEFEQAVEMKVDELRYASAVGLKHIAQVGAGTGNMVAQLKNYLNGVPHISMALKTTLEGIVNDLSEQGKAIKAAKAAAADLSPAVSDLKVERKMKKVLDLKTAANLRSSVGLLRDNGLFMSSQMVDSAI